MDTAFSELNRREVGEVKMNSDDLVLLCVLGGIGVILVISLVVIHFREKRRKDKPIYYSAVGNWLSGKRR